jgi:hypothetical protein
MDTGTFAEKYVGQTSIFLKSESTLNPTEIRCYRESNAPGIQPLSLEEVLLISAQAIQCQ